MNLDTITAGKKSTTNTFEKPMITIVAHTIFAKVVLGRIFSYSSL